MPVFSISPSSLHRLRHHLDGADGLDASTILRDAGAATGDAMHAHWRNRIAERTGLDDAGDLDIRWFGPLLDELCIDRGWGSLSVAMIGERALLLEAGDWAEALPGSAATPSCHFSCGCLAAFLTAQAGAPLSVVEVECLSRGDAACRFLAASEAALGEVHDLLAAGRSWREAYSSEELPG